MKETSYIELEVTEENVPCKEQIRYIHSICDRCKAKHCVLRDFIRILIQIKNDLKTIEEDKK